MRTNAPNQPKHGGDPIADYIRADTPLPAYYYLKLKMEIFDETAIVLLESLLLFRYSNISRNCNKWLDDEGRIYIISPTSRRYCHHYRTKQHHHKGGLA